MLANFFMKTWKFVKGYNRDLAVEGGKEVTS
jgi:hypothetical protein